MICLGFTRPPEYLEKSIRLAESMGFSVRAAPSLIRIPAPESEFIEIFKRVDRRNFYAVVFNSSAAVKECLKRLGEDFVSACTGAIIAAIGPETKNALENVGISVDIVPEIYSSEGLVDIVGTSALGKKILLIRSDAGSDVLEKGLGDYGAETVTFEAYHLEPFGICEETEALVSDLYAGKLNVMAFTSPLSAKVFYGHMCNILGDDAASKCLCRQFVAVIGHPTANAVRSLGKEPDLISGRATFADMLEDVRLRLFPVYDDGKV
mgnify:CR=1 FL=1